MKAFLACLFLAIISIAPAVSAAQELPEDQFVRIYGVLQQADRSLGNGRSASAWTNYTNALYQLKKLKNEYPEWNSKVVKYRIDYTTAKIEEIAKAAPATNATGAGATDGPLELEPAGPVDMKLTWELGKRYLHRVELTQSSDVNMAGQPPMTQQSKVTQEIALSAVKEREGGGRELEMEVVSVAMEVKMAGTAITFDSKQPATGDASNPLAPVFRRMIGARITYLTDANGKIQSLQGVEEFIKRVAGPEAESQGMISAMKGMLSEDNLKQMSPLMMGLPDKPVKVGDTWPVKVEAPMGPIGNLNMNMNYTFKGWQMHDNRKCAVLEYTGDISSKAGAAEAEMLTIDQGKTSGRTWYDPAAKTAVGSTGNQDLTLKLNAPQQAQSMSTRLRQVVVARLVEIAELPK